MCDVSLCHLRKRKYSIAAISKEKKTNELLGMICLLVHDAINFGPVPPLRLSTRCYRFWDASASHFPV